jgi:hypothetical protein
MVPSIFWLIERVPILLAVAFAMHVRRMSVRQALAH